MDERFTLVERFVKDLCKPSSSVMGDKGAEQLIIILDTKASGADAFMEIWNQQGFEVDGGTLFIEWRESHDHVIMTGPVELESEGTI